MNKKLEIDPVTRARLDMFAAHALGGILSRGPVGSSPGVVSLHDAADEAVTAAKALFNILHDRT